MKIKYFIQHKFEVVTVLDDIITFHPLIHLICLTVSVNMSSTEFLVSEMICKLSGICHMNREERNDLILEEMRSNDQEYWVESSVATVS